MARKVFITFLGTSNYVATKYELNKCKSSIVRFIQQALIELVCKDWTEDDCIKVFYTQKSYECNWVDGGHKRFNEDEANERLGLESVLNRMNLKMKVETFMIEDDLEIWSMFDKIYSSLDQNDHIYLDVTHAFRSIPLFSVVLLNYARFMKDTTLSAIYYGAFEKLGSISDVLKKQKEDRIAPIIDMTGLVQLQDTNVAASNFIEYGKLGRLGKDWNMVYKHVDKKGQKALEKLKEGLKSLDDYILTCRMQFIENGVYYKTILDNIRIAQKSMLSPEKKLLWKIKMELDNYGFKPTKTSDNIEAAIKWASEYRMLQQAYTLGQEYIITKVCNLLRDINPYSVDVKNSDKRFREFVSGILGITLNNGVYEYRGELENFSGLADRLLYNQNYSWIQSIKIHYEVLRSYRNSLNHAKRNPIDVEVCKNEFDEAYNASMNIIKQVSGES